MDPATGCLMPCRECGRSFWCSDGVPVCGCCVLPECPGCGSEVLSAEARDHGGYHASCEPPQCCYCGEYVAGAEPGPDGDVWCAGCRDEAAAKAHAALRDDARQAPSVRLVDLAAAVTASDPDNPPTVDDLEALVGLGEAADTLADALARFGRSGWAVESAEAARILHGVVGRAVGY